MDPETMAIYESRVDVYAARAPRRVDAAKAFGASVPEGVVRADLGSGPATNTANLGRPVIALDAAHAMLTRALGVTPWAWPVQADLEALPFRRGGLGAAWARASYLHVPARHLPLALADLHRALAPDARFVASIARGDAEWERRDDGDLPGRYFAGWAPEPLRQVLTGAGFKIETLDADDEWIHGDSHRARTLPDYVGPEMRLLMCGLNPSIYAADAGVGFARPGNRFWPAALAAGIVSRDRDPRHALLAHRVGMTDLVKRATRGANELGAEEYREGVERVRHLVSWLQPAVVCFLGLAGYRAAVDRHAVAGPQRDHFGGALTYLMPNPSGVNAHATPKILCDHLQAAARLAESRPPSDA